VDLAGPYQRRLPKSLLQVLDIGEVEQEKRSEKKRRRKIEKKKERKSEVDEPPTLITRLCWLLYMCSGNN